MKLWTIIASLSAAQATVDPTIIDSTLVYASIDSLNEANESKSDAERFGNLRRSDASSTTVEAPPTSSQPQATPSIVSISTVMKYLSEFFRSMYTYTPSPKASQSKTTGTQSVQCTNSVLTGKLQDEDYTMAYAASGGFFTDMRRSDFMLLRDIACYENLNKVQEFVDKGVDSIHAMDLYLDKNFWQQNYEPVFGCQFQRRMGYRGDGGKWVCDPHRINHQNCLVYSIGARLEHSFESAVAGGIGN